jgi:cytochrome c biogenesis factor
MAMTVIIFIGTSWPIISGLFGKAKSSVDISFYNEWNLPLAILILVTNAIAVFLAWKQGSYAFAFKRAVISLIAAAVATVMLNAFGVNELKYVLLGFTAFFSLFVNLELIIRKVIIDPTKIGAYLSHFGVSLLMLGVLASAGYSSTKHLSLKLGESTEVFGYKVTYTGKTQIEKELKDREKYQFHLKIEKNGSSDIISSIIYLSDFNQRSAPFFEPGVKSYFTTDIYVAPKSIDISQAGNTIGLTKGSVTALPFDTSKQIMLAGFDMASHQDEAKAKGGVTLGAIISYGNIIDTLYVQMDMQNNIKIPTWKKIQGYDYEAGFMDFVINQEAMGQSQVVIAFKKDGEPVKEPVESYTFEISTKPFINLVWFGTIALAAGFFIAMSRKKKALAVIKEEVKTESDEKSEE